MSAEVELPPDEERRLAALRKLDLLDSESEERFERITRMAQRIFGTEMAAVTLVDADRQWFKSRQGPLGAETSRETSFCSRVILKKDVTMVVPDARLDERFAENPLVLGNPNIRFYAGHPIQAPGGEQIGTLCVIDSAPREGVAFDVEALVDLAAMVDHEIATVGMAIGDELTGLSNRRGFEALGEKVMEVAARMGLPVAVIYVDLDNMKPINDEHGHDAGDRALNEIARLLEGTLRGSDVIARIGGDEFCALLAGAAAADTKAAAARLRDAVKERNAAKSAPYELSLSIGIATAAEVSGPALLPTLVDQADQAMLAEKRTKKRPR